MSTAPRKSWLDWFIIVVGVLIALGFGVMFVSQMYLAIQGIDA